MHIEFENFVSGQIDFSLIAFSLNDETFKWNKQKTKRIIRNELT